MRPLARAPPCFSHSESAWSDPPLGRHRVFAYPRTPWVPARSGATVFFMFRVRLGHTPVRAPPCFSLIKEEWGARPLGRHRVFHAPSAPRARSRSGATVFFTHRRRLGHTPARAPPCFSCSECHWRALPLGRHRVFHIPRASGVPALETRKPDLQNLIFPSTRAYKPAPVTLVLDART